MASNWNDSDRNENRMGDRIGSSRSDDRRLSRDDRGFDRSTSGDDRDHGRNRDSDRFQSREGGYGRDSGYMREGIYGRDDRMNSSSDRSSESNMGRMGGRDRDMNDDRDSGHYDYGRSGGSDFSLGIGSVGNVSGRNINRNFGMNRDAAYGEQYRQNYDETGRSSGRDYGYGADYGSRGSDSSSGRHTDRETSRDFSRSHFNESSQGDFARYAGLTSSTNRGMSENLGSGLGTRVNHSGKGPKGWKRSDDRIREDVSEALERHPDIDASEIEIDVKDGLVTLKGHVDHRRSKRMAEDAIEHLAGVHDIRNELSVNQSLFEQAKEFFSGDSSTSTKSKTTTTTTSKH